MLGACTRLRGVELIEVDLLTSPGNYAIVRMPGRRFPGVVMQGDSLSILAYDAQEIAVALSDIWLAIAEEANNIPVPFTQSPFNGAQTSD